MVVLRPQGAEATLRGTVAIAMKEPLLLRRRMEDLRVRL